MTKPVQVSRRDLRRLRRAAGALWCWVEDLLYWSRRDNRGGPFRQSEGLGKSRGGATRALRTLAWVCARDFPPRPGYGVADAMNAKILDARGRGTLRP